MNADVTNETYHNMNIQQGWGEAQQAKLSTQQPPFVDALFSIESMAAAMKQSDLSGLAQTSLQPNGISQCLELKHPFNLILTEILCLHVSLEKEPM